MLLRSLSRPLLIVVVALALVSAAGCGKQARKASHLEKGHAYLAAGNLDKARVEFKNVLQIDVKDAEALYQMGVIAEKQGVPRQAAQFYQAAIDVDLDHVGARVGLGRLYVLAGAPERTLELIKPVLQKHPDDAGLLTLRAAVRLRQKDAAGALADAERAVALAPTNEEAVAVLAGIYYSQGEKDKTQAVFEQAIQKNPATIELRLVLAKFYVRNNEPAEAEAVLSKLVELEPREKAHRERLALFYLTSNQLDAAEHTLRQAIKDVPDDNSVKVDLIDFLAGHRSRADAESELNKMIAAAPASVDLKFALAKFYEEGKDFKKAQAVYQGIIDHEQLEPAGLAARNQLAVLRLQDNDMPGALALTNEVLATSPRDEYALLLRGNIELAKREPRAAIVDLRAVLRDEPTAAGVLKSLARAHLANGEPDSAEETLRLAVEANPKDLELRLVLAELLARSGKTDQSLTMIEQMLAEKPSNLDALEAQFQVATAANEWATAKSAADAIVAIQPKSAVGYLYEGLAAEAEKRNADAVRNYATAAELQPDAPQPLQALVRVLRAEKKNDEAIKWLDQFSARFPTNALGPDAKGEVLFVAGKQAEAKEAFKMAIARDPTWWIPYRDMAAVQLAAKNPEAAIETLRKAQAVVVQKNELGAELASVLERLGRLDEAIAEYEDLLKRNPQSKALANRLALLLVTHKTDQASLDLAKALVTRFAESANPAFLDTYGWVMYKRGEASSSVSVLERVVAKVPNDTVARYHLGMAQSLAGDMSAARDNLTRAVNSGTKFFGLDEAKATLDKLAPAPAAIAATPKT